MKLRDAKRVEIGLQVENGKKVLRLRVDDESVDSCTGTIREEERALTAVKAAIDLYEHSVPRNSTDLIQLEAGVGIQLANCLSTTTATKNPWSLVGELAANYDVQLALALEVEAYDRLPWQLVGGFSVNGSAAPISVRTDITIQRRSTPEVEQPRSPIGIEIISADYPFRGDAQFVYHQVAKSAGTTALVEPSNRSILERETGPKFLGIYVGHADGTKYQAGGGYFRLPGLIHQMGEVMLYAVLACQSTHSRSYPSIENGGPGYERIARLTGKPTISIQASFSLASATLIAKWLVDAIFDNKRLDLAVQDARKKARDFDFTQINGGIRGGSRYYWPQLVLATPSWESTELVDKVIESLPSRDKLVLLEREQEILRTVVAAPGDGISGLNALLGELRHDSTASTEKIEALSRVESVFSSSDVSVHELAAMTAYDVLVDSGGI